MAARDGFIRNLLVVLFGVMFLVIIAAAGFFLISPTITVRVVLQPMGMPAMMGGMMGGMTSGPMGQVQPSMQSLGMTPGMMAPPGQGSNYLMTFLGFSLALAVLAIVFIGAYYVISGVTPNLLHKPDPALHILRERYSRGEITRQEYLGIKEELEKA